MLPMLLMSLSTCVCFYLLYLLRVLLESLKKLDQKLVTSISRRQLSKLKSGNDLGLCLPLCNASPTFALSLCVALSLLCCVSVLSGTTASGLQPVEPSVLSAISLIAVLIELEVCRLSFLASLTSLCLFVLVAFPINHHSPRQFVSIRLQL